MGGNLTRSTSSRETSVRGALSRLQRGREEVCKLICKREWKIEGALKFGLFVIDVTVKWVLKT